MTTSTPSPPSSLEPDQRRELAAVVAELERRGVGMGVVAASGPRTDDELWQSVYELTGYAIPRVAVCEGHEAPFSIFANVYFCRPGWEDVLMIGNRGGGKTTIGGFLHGSKCRYNPGYKSMLAGANEPQGDRGYAEFKRFARNLEPEIRSTLRKATHWWNRSVLEVLTATIKQMNGPHPHLAQFDEPELTTVDVFEEFGNTAQGDERYASQNFLSTTRKYVGGLVQKIVASYEEAKRRGETPEWHVAIFCVFETMREVPNCQRAPEAERVARLTELGMDPCSTCSCHEVRKGTWDDGSPRTFDTVCRGRAFRSRGFVQLPDVWRRFRRLLRETWEAQQECLRPDPEGVVHRWLDPTRHVLPTWYPYPEYGPVYRSWDWGGQNPHSVHFEQLLIVPVTLQVFDHYGEVMFEREIPEGTLVTFDEVYYEGGSYRDLGYRVFDRTEEWHEHGFKFRVERDICDPAGRTAKLDVAQAAEDRGVPEPDWSARSAPRIDSVNKHKEWGADDRLLIVGSMCPWLLEEYAVYHYPKGRDGRNQSEDPEKAFDHAMDDQRMLIWYLYKLEDENRESDDEAGPGAVPRSGSVMQREQPDKQPPMVRPDGNSSARMPTLADVMGGHADGVPSRGSVRRTTRHVAR